MVFIMQIYHKTIETCLKRTENGGCEKLRSKNMRLNKKGLTCTFLTKIHFQYKLNWTEVLNPFQFLNAPHILPSKPHFSEKKAPRKRRKYVFDLGEKI